MKKECFVSYYRTEYPFCREGHEDCSVLTELQQSHGCFSSYCTADCKTSSCRHSCILKRRRALRYNCITEPCPEQKKILHCRCSVDDLSSEEAGYFKRESGIVEGSHFFVFHEGLSLDSVEERCEHQKLMEKFQSENIYVDPRTMIPVDGGLYVLQNPYNPLPHDPTPWIKKMREFIALANIIRKSRPPIESAPLRTISPPPVESACADYSHSSAMMQAPTGEFTPDIIIDANTMEIGDTTGRPLHTSESPASPLIEAVKENTEVGKKILAAVNKNTSVTDKGFQSLKPLSHQSLAALVPTLPPLNQEREDENWVSRTTAVKLTQEEVGTLKKQRQQGENVLLDGQEFGKDTKGRIWTKAGGGRKYFYLKKTLSVQDISR